MSVKAGQAHCWLAGDVAADGRGSRHRAAGGRSKVYELMRAGVLRSVKIGGSRRVSVTALADYVAELERQAA
jgi:excisionase family DNA binding protein